MRYLTFWCISLLLVAVSCNGRHERLPETSASLNEISDLTSDAEHWADSICSSLTLRQKVAQLLMPAVYARNDYWTLKLVREYMDSCIGSVLLLKGDTLMTRELVDSMETSAKVAPFIAMDAEWGLAMRLPDAPKFPANSSISPSADDQLMYDYGREVARECRLLGINMILGPVVDVSAPGSYMFKRSLGDDPVRVADLALAYARGLEDGDVISVAKHFPGHGSVKADTHRSKGIIQKSLNELDSVDLYPFRKWVEQRLTGIMVGHLAVPSIDSKMLPAAVSETVINDLLRNDLGFNGLILTDAINMKGATGFYGVDALKAGADIIIAPVNTSGEIDRIMEAVRNGEITEREIDSKVKKVLFYKYLIGLDSVHGKRASGESIISAKADSISRKLSLQSNLYQ